jgi:hypothetical protein
MLAPPASDPAKFSLFLLKTILFLWLLQAKRRADERTRTADLESLYEFACVHTSLYRCDRKLRFFRRYSMIRGFAWSIVYQCVPARLQYMRGRDELMRQWSIHDPIYRSKTQHVGICHRVWMR